jgi:hypothetical protein
MRISVRLLSLALVLSLFHRTAASSPILDTNPYDPITPEDLPVTAILVGIGVVTAIGVGAGLVYKTFKAKKITIGHAAASAGGVKVEASAIVIEDNGENGPEGNSLVTPLNATVLTLPETSLPGAHAGSTSVTINDPVVSDPPYATVNVDTGGYGNIYESDWEALAYETVATAFLVQSDDSPITYDPNGSRILVDLDYFVTLSLTETVPPSFATAGYEVGIGLGNADGVSEWIYKGAKQLAGDDSQFFATTVSSDISRNLLAGQQYDGFWVAVRAYGTAPVPGTAFLLLFGLFGVFSRNVHARRQVFSLARTHQAKNVA